MNLVLAIDVGTSWCKAGLYDPAGRLVALNRAPSGLGAYGPGQISASDDDLARWWSSVAEAVRPLVAGAGAPWAALAFSSRAGHVLFFDSQMRGIPVGPGEAAALQAARAEAYGAPGWGEGGPWARAYIPGMVAHAWWLGRAFPELHRQVRRAGVLHDWLLWRLTGAWVTDPCNGPVGLSDWPEAAMALSGLGREAFAAMLPSEAVAGSLLPEAAAELGLPPGLPVACGGHDGALANLGGGAWRVGDALITLGTRSVVRIVTGAPMDGEFGYPIPPGHYAWVAGEYSGVDRIAAAREKGRKEYRAALETVAENVAGIVARARAVGLNPRRFRVTGGLSNVPLLRRLLRAALGAPLYRVDPEAGLRGAAMLAAVAAGWYTDVPAAARGMRYRRVWPELNAGEAHQG